ncbi:ABC transporter ATP-binding protein, partial [Klebsiella oxytoca]
MIAMAMAGTQRILDLLAEESETDQGYVTLVNAIEENGQLVEVRERTNTWAWKIPKDNGENSYVKLAGDIVLKDVD